MKFNEEEKRLMMSLGLNIDFNNISDDDWIRIEEKVSEKLLSYGFNHDYTINSLGIICESILDKLP